MISYWEEEGRKGNSPVFSLFQKWTNELVRSQEAPRPAPNGRRLRPRHRHRRLASAAWIPNGRWMDDRVCMSLVSDVTASSGSSRSIEDIRVAASARITESDIRVLNETERGYALRFTGGLGGRGLSEGIMPRELDRRGMYTPNDSLYVDNYGTYS